MREKTKKLSSILLCLVFCFSFSTAVYAASYIYYDGGLKSATVDVENRLSNSSVYKNSVSAWNSTNTPVNPFPLSDTDQNSGLTLSPYSRS